MIHLAYYTASSISKTNPSVDGRSGTSGAYGTSGTGTTGYGSTGAHHTAGPHSSDLANKADPRVDSDRGMLFTRLNISQVY